MTNPLTNQVPRRIITTTVPDTPLNDAYHVGSFNCRRIYPMSDLDP